MKHFLITFHAPDDYGGEDRLAAFLAKKYYVFARDVSAGLFFIVADAGSTATMVLEHIADGLQEEAAHTLYVFEMAGTWDGAADPKVIQQIGEHVFRD